MAVFIIILAEHRRIVIRTHLRESIPGNFNILCVHTTTVTCNVFVAQELLLCRACAYGGVGRRDDSHERRELLTYH